MPKKSKIASKTKQIEIAKFYLDNSPQTSYRRVGLQFGCTANQVRNYVAKYENEEYAEARSLKENEEVQAEKIALLKRLKDTAITSLVDEVVVDVLAEIRMRKDMTTDDRLTAINKLTMAMQRTQKLQFVEALRKPDAQKVIQLCKLIDNKLTETQIIELWQKIELEK